VALADGTLEPLALRWRGHRRLIPDETPGIGQDGRAPALITTNLGIGAIAEQGLGVALPQRIQSQPRRFEFHGLSGARPRRHGLPPCARSGRVAPARTRPSALPGTRSTRTALPAAAPPARARSRP